MLKRFTIYLLIVLASLDLVFSSQVFAQSKAESLKLNTVVIDAGHGGKDAGSVSADKKTYEKTINLAVAKLLGEKISNAYPDVKVVYTRTKDEYLTLNRRADIANNNNADLFISIHVNSVKSSQPRGFSVHILGQSRDKNTDLFSYNMEVCKKENSVILLEDDYTTKYQGFDPSDPESYIFFNLMQNAFYEQSITFAASVHEELKKGPIYTDRGLWQDPFYVLWKTKMPAALVEIGFISNAKDLAILKSASGQAQIATRLFDAFVTFKTKYDQSVNVSTVDPKVEASKKEDASKQEEIRKQEEAKRKSEEAKPEEAEILKEEIPVKTEDIKSKIEESLNQGQKSNQDTSYGTQVMSLGHLLEKNHKEFKGHTATIVKVGNLYKYIIGVSSNPEEARRINKEIRKDFPGAFLVSFSEGKVEVYR